MKILLSKTKQVFLFLCSALEQGREIKEALYKTYSFIYKELKVVPSFPICISRNKTIAHYVYNSDKKKVFLKEGDYLRIDLGLQLKENKTDYARSFIFKKGKLEPFCCFGTKICLLGSKELNLESTEENFAKNVYNKIVSTSKDYYISPELWGHRVGKKLHERPFLSFYRDPFLSKLKFIEGVYCVEVFVGKQKFGLVSRKNNFLYICTKRSSFFFKFRTRFFSKQMVLFEFSFLQAPLELLEKELAQKKVKREPFFSSSIREIEHREEMFELNKNNQVKILS